MYSPRARALLCSGRYSYVPQPAVARQRDRHHARPRHRPTRGSRGPRSKRPALRAPETTTAAGQTKTGTWDPSTGVSVKPTLKPAPTIHQPLQPQWLQMMPEADIPPERHRALGA